MHQHDGAQVEQALLAHAPSELRRPDGRPVPRDPILLVDPRPGIRAFVGRALAAVGHPTLTAADAGAALALVQQVQPSLILLDARAQPAGGCRFLAGYHRLPPPHAPVIVFAATLQAAARAVPLPAGVWVRWRCELEEALAVIQATAAEGATLPPSVALDTSGRVAVLAWDDDGRPCWLAADGSHDGPTVGPCTDPSCLPA